MSREYRRGERWYIDFRDLSGRRVRRSTTARTLGEARQLRVASEADANRRRILGEESTASSMKASDFLTGEYLTHCRARHSDTTFSTEAKRIPFIAELLGGLTLDQITPAVIQKFVDVRRTIINRRGRIAGVSTVNRELAIISAMLHEAHRRGHLASSPDGIVRLLTAQEPATVEMTDREERDLLDAAGDRKDLRSAIIFSLHTGLRRSELLRAEWSHVEGSEIVVSGTKGKRVRRVPLNSVALAILAELPERVPSGRIFWMWEDEPLKAAFEATRRRAGVSASWKAMRHAFASRLVRAGVGIHLVQEYLGHASIEETRKYLHAAGKEERRESVERLTRGTIQAQNQNRIPFG